MTTPLGPPDEVDVRAVTSSASVLTGSLWSAANQTLPQAYTLVQSVVAARVLGPSDLGRQSYIAWAALTINMLVTGGVPVALTRSVAEWVGRGRPGVARWLVSWSWRIEFVGALIGASVLCVMAFHRPALRSAWLWAALACLFAVLQTVPYAVMIGTQRWRLVASFGLAQGGVATVAVVVVLLAGGGITGMFVVEAVSAAVSLAWWTMAARRPLRGERPRKIDRDIRSHFNRYAGVATLVMLLETVVWRRSEFLFLERYATPAALANFSIAFAMTTAIARVPEGMATVLSPAVATMFGAEEFDRIRTGFSRGVRLVCLTTLPIAAGTVAVGPSLLRLIYGSEFDGAGSVLLVLLAGLPMIPLAALGMALLDGLGRLRLALTTIACAAIVDIVLAVVLVPTRGAIGAAIASAGGQLVGGIGLIAIGARAAGGLDLRLKSLLRATVASALMGGIAFAVLSVVPGPAGIVAAIVAGVAAFPFLLRVLGGLDVEDASWLEATAGDRLGGLVGRAARLLIARGR